MLRDAPEAHDACCKIAITPTTRATAKGRSAWAVSPKVKTRSDGCTVFLTPVHNLDTSPVCSKQPSPSRQGGWGDTRPGLRLSNWDPSCPAHPVKEGVESGGRVRETRLIDGSIGVLSAAKLREAARLLRGTRLQYFVRWLHFKLERGLTSRITHYSGDIGVRFLLLDNVGSDLVANRWEWPKRHAGQITQRLGSRGQGCLQAKITTATDIDKLQIDVFPVFREPTEVPQLCRLHRVATIAGRLTFDLIRRAIHDVDSAAVCFPAGDCLREALVRVREAPIMLFFEFILSGARCWVAAQPELFYETVAYFIFREPNKGCPLVWRDNPADLLIQPSLVFGG